MVDGLPTVTFQDCPHKDWVFSRQMAWSMGYNEALAKCLAAPIDMLMFCPKCGAQHVDRADEAQGWTNPPHATHTCQRCGLLWRPSNSYTNGVAILPAEEAKHVERIAATWPGGHGGTQAATRRMFIVCLTHIGRRVVLAVYANGEDDAKRKALGRYTGFTVERIVQKDTPAVFRIHDDAWFEIMGAPIIRAMRPCARHEGIPFVFTAYAGAVATYCPHCDQENTPSGGRSIFDLERDEGPDA